MAVSRIWFPNAPSGSIDAPQRSQLSVGYRNLTAAVVPVLAVPYNYFRRYLNDPVVNSTIGPSVSVTPTATTTFISYIRKYLND